jgi:hypothetical protein
MLATGERRPPCLCQSQVRFAGDSAGVPAVAATASRVAATPGAPEILIYDLTCSTSPTRGALSASGTAWRRWRRSRAWSARDGVSGLAHCRERGPAAGGCSNQKTGAEKNESNNVEKENDETMWVAPLGDGQGHERGACARGEGPVRRRRTQVLSETEKAREARGPVLLRPPSY